MKELYEDIYKRKFSFGNNWKNFLNKLTDERINEAIVSLKNFLERDFLSGSIFIDIGCGSGLFSLAAKKMGAEKVVSVDVDEYSVSCAKYLKDKFYPGDESWEIKQGSALDKEFVSSLGKFDIVYSWGVLHHTGSMWEAIKNIESLMGENSVFYLAIYNEKTGFQGSAFWKKVKEFYSKNNTLIRKFIEVIYFIQFFVKGVMKGENRFKYIANYKSVRGMNWWNDVKDWLGGYPYEYAKAEAMVDYFRNNNYKVLKIKDCHNGIGCNEFLVKNSLL